MKVIICLVALDCVSAWSTLWNGSGCRTVVVLWEGIIKCLGNIDIIGENLFSFLFYCITCYISQETWILAKKPENLCIWCSRSISPFPNKPWFLSVCSTSLLKTLQEKEKLLIMSNFSFSHSVFYSFEDFSSIFIKFEIVLCKVFQFGRVYNLSFGKELTRLDILCSLVRI